MTSIYRHQGSQRVLVAHFPSSDDAVRCFKSMAYNLGERLIMVTNGSQPSTRPHNCCINSMGEYVLFPAFRSDYLEPSR